MLTRVATKDGRLNSFATITADIARNRQKGRARNTTRPRYRNPPQCPIRGKRSLSYQEIPTTAA